LKLMSLLRVRNW